MNFTSDIKKEIIAKGLGEEKRIPAISAFLRTSGDVGIRDGTPAFYFVSETENVAEFFMAEFFEAFGAELFISHATKDKLSGKAKLVIECPAESSILAAKALGLVKRTGALREGIWEKFLDAEEKAIAYIQGAFLGGGSCTLPNEGNKTGYHLEVVFSNRKMAYDFSKLLAKEELIAKLAERKDNYVVYIKSKELISDFLSIIGAEGSLKKFSSIVAKRDQANNDNRAKNCFSGNADKTAIAAVKQVVVIEGLKNSGGLEDLGEELVALAETRLNNPSKSLQELAEMLGVSKSCLNHRMRRLMELSEKRKRE